ncbi:MAG: hypothetical protein PHI42_07590 [Paludibacteraceae bacterium]|nr:hypothetical protein [Paludibacteraceae bacterium]
MKRLHYLIIATSICVTAVAQDNDSTVTHNVSIEKEYIPQVIKVKRTDIELPSTEPTVTKTEVTYSTETKAMETKSNFYPAKESELKSMKRPAYKSGFIRFGVGFPLNWLGELWYPVFNTNTDYFDINLNHYGISNNGKKLIDTDLDLRYSKKLRTGQLYSSLGLANTGFNYYGKDSVFTDNNVFYDFNNEKVAGKNLIPTKQSITQLNANLGFRSLKEVNNWSYDGVLNYHLLGATNSLREHQIGLNLNAGYSLGENHIIADLQGNVYLYNAPILQYTSDSIWAPQAVISFRPRYERQWDNLKVRAGAKLWFSINKGNVVAASPDIEVRYAVAKLLDVYGGIGGSYEFTSLATTFKENRYYNMNERMEANDYTPFDFFGGFNIRPFRGFVFDASISYKLISNQHFFYNKQFDCLSTPNEWPDKQDSERVYSNTYTVDDARATLLNIEARLAYNLKERYNFHVKGKYNGWNVLTPGVQAWNKPTWEGDAGIEAMITKNFNLNANFYYASERLNKLPKKDGTLDVRTLAPIYDLNLSASYTFQKQWSLFVQANNILGSSKAFSYQQWYGYDNIGFNILIGATIAF